MKKIIDVKNIVEKRDEYLKNKMGFNFDENYKHIYPNFNIKEKIDLKNKSDEYINNYRRYNHLGYNCGCKECYNPKTNEVKKLLCHNFSCIRCRPILKKYFYFALMEIFIKKEFDQHYILTCKGKEYREKNTIKQTFNDMSKNWDKLRELINYWYYKKWNINNKFSYVALPRSQQDGSCHYHILTNINLEMSWIREKIKKYQEMGFSSRGKNHNPVAYLSTDFFKDHEWWIPYGLRHFNTSKDIKLFDRNGGISDCVIYRKNPNLNEFENLEKFNNEVLSKFGTYLPFEIWLKYFSTIDQFDNKKEIIKSDLKMFNNNRKKKNEIDYQNYIYKLGGYKNGKKAI